MRVKIATHGTIREDAGRNALAWLRCVAGDPSRPPADVVSACEVRLAIHYGKRPSAGAVAWLLGQCEATDLAKRAEARNAAMVAMVTVD